MIGFQPDLAQGIFPCTLALFRRLEAVIECVANEMIEWRLQLFQNIAINARLLPEDRELNLFAQLPGKVPDHTWKATHAIRQRPHPADKHFVVQPTGEILDSMGEIFQSLERFIERRLNGADLAQ